MSAILAGREGSGAVAAARRAPVRHLLGRALLYATILAGALLFVAPLAWMLSTAVKSPAEAYAVPIRWLPETFRWDNFVRPWRGLPFAQFYANSAVITLANVVLTVASSSLVAFAFARMRFRGRGVLFVLVLSTMMLPKQVTLIPLYVAWSKLGLLNTYWPLIVPALFGQPFSIFLLRQYMLTIPSEIDDAARIDGAGWLALYGRIILPLAAPALGVAAIFNFTLHWNEFIEPLVFLNDLRAYTVPLGLTLLNSRYAGEVPQVMAQSLLSLLPVLALFFVAQRRYLQGIVVTGLKG
jgi:multiple sugar transport system permease protein